MIVNRRHILATLAAAILFAAPAISRAETVRIGLPTKTYWPTTVAEAAAHQKFFEKEGITAEITIYRGGAECFEALAAGAADLILDAPALPAAGRKKGVMSKAVANGAMGNFGWQLMVLTKSTLDVGDLNGRKIAITSAGSGSDLLALWTIQEKNLTSAWIVTDKYAKEKPQAVQKALNALYGGLMFMRDNREAAVKLIGELYEMPDDIAAAEYENTILKLETDGSMAGDKIADAVQLSLDMAKLGGMKDLVPAGEIISTQFKPVPTRP
jgi:NitT/TauT family transport system substrate-binding protein